jgi:hypothetical protein
MANQLTVKGQNPGFYGEQPPPIPGSAAAAKGLVPRSFPAVRALVPEHSAAHVAVARAPDSISQHRGHVMHAVPPVTDQVPHAAVARAQANTRPNHEHATGVQALEHFLDRAVGVKVPDRFLFNATRVLARVLSTESLKCVGGRI